jgi:hypothetical protein
MPWRAQRPRDDQIEKRMPTEESNRYSRVYLSVGHLKNASHFARLTGEIEQHTEFVWGTIKPHEAYAMSAVLSSVAFLEASVNELYADAAGDSVPSEILRSIGTGYAMEMPKDVRSILAILWTTERFRMTARTLEKFQVALKAAGQEQFDKGSQPYQDVALLIRLRNALIHFKPESRHHGDVPADLERKLGGKFALNPLAPNDPLLPFLPHKCLGYGCALWALKSSVAFTKDVFSRMGVKAFHGGWLVEMTVDYASMRPLKEIAAKYGAKAEHIVEHAADPDP